MMKVEVFHSQWACGDVEPAYVLAGGEHELDPTELDTVVLRALVAASAAGVLTIDDEGYTLPSGVVEPDEVSEVKLAEAQADGSWLEGQQLQAEVEATDREERGLPALLEG